MLLRKIIGSALVASTTLIGSHVHAQPTATSIRAQAKFFNAILNPSEIGTVNPTNTFNGFLQRTDLGDKGQTSALGAQLALGKMNKSVIATGGAVLDAWNNVHATVNVKALKRLFVLNKTGATAIGQRGLYLRGAVSNTSLLSKEKYNSQTVSGGLEQVFDAGGNYRLNFQKEYNTSVIGKQLYKLAAEIKVPFKRLDGGISKGSSAAFKVFVGFNPKSSSELKYGRSWTCDELIKKGMPHSETSESKVNGGFSVLLNIGSKPPRTVN